MKKHRTSIDCYLLTANAILIKHGTVTSKQGYVYFFFLVYALKKDPAWLFQNGVFPTNQLDLLLKPIYTILK
ncbi:MAG TPA: hypothetical protein VMW42_10070 [Desulfatiglandales bacterium]|nr:hypothetical protein [Desulfatiglandales bacterium]